jgi:hypothetical protein
VYDSARGRLGFACALAVTATALTRMTAAANWGAMLIRMQILWLCQGRGGEVRNAYVHEQMDTRLDFLISRYAKIPT